jgi:hypothetical protein
MRRCLTSCLLVYVMTWSLATQAGVFTRVYWETFHLQYVDAGSIKDVLTEILELDKVDPEVHGIYGLFVLEPSNRLMVVATPEGLSKIHQVLDSPPDPPADYREVSVLYLEYVDAEDMEVILGSLFLYRAVWPYEIEMIADKPTNSLVLFADDSWQVIISEAANILDRPKL